MNVTSFGKYFFAVTKNNKLVGYKLENDKFKLVTPEIQTQYLPRLLRVGPETPSTLSTIVRQMIKNNMSFCRNINA